MREDSISEVLFQDAGNFNAGDSSLMNDLLSEGAVDFLSHEFLAKISMMIAMSPWYSWRIAPRCPRSGLKLGPMDNAQEWCEAVVVHVVLRTPAGGGALEREADDLQEL